MGMIEYINVQNSTIDLIGPSREKIRLKRSEKKVLSDWYMRYVPKYLKPTGSVNSVKSIKVKSQSAEDRVSKAQKQKEIRKVRKEYLLEKRSKVRGGAETVVSQKERIEKRLKNRESRRASQGKSRIPRNRRHKTRSNLKIVDQYYKKLLELSRIHSSNDIGIGILSYNRLESIKKLIGSIRKFTDLKKTTVIVSDESTNNNVKKWLDSQNDIVVLNNSSRIGVAGNTNRLLRCLERFKYKLILNDDVEVLNKGWDQAYVSAMKETGYHHFCMRQYGVYGASRSDGKLTTVKELSVQTITDKPHGAVLAFDNVAFEKVGYFDESYGKYGMEHVDWSNRVALSGIQPPGFHDIVGIEKFLTIGKSKSAVPVSERTSGLSTSRAKFNKHKNNKKRIFIEASNKSKVSGVSFIIPFSGEDRLGALKKTINNIKSLKYPRIEIIISEEDRNGPSNIDSSVNHVLIKPKYTVFCKAACINKGASVATSNILFIHDADLLCEHDYVYNIIKILRVAKSVHGGKNVIYLDKNDNPIHMTTGFMGGSIACKKSEFFAVGGFNEAFYGHGYEDDEFYSRLSSRGLFDCEISNFVHQYHNNIRSYLDRSDKNKTLRNTWFKKIVGNRIALLRADLAENGYGSNL